MNKKEIALEIMSLTDKLDVRYLKNICDEQIRSISNALKYDLRPGDSVKVDSKRLIEEGIIKKINRTRAVVEINNKKWNVPFSMITKL